MNVARRWTAATLMLLGPCTASAEPPCRHPRAVVAALETLDPGPLDCLKGQPLTPAGLEVVVSPSGKVAVSAGTEGSTVRACLAKRVAPLALPPTACTFTVRWPLSMDAWPSATPAKASPHGEAPALGGPSGHCPMPGQPEGRRHGGTWQPLGFSPTGLFAYGQLSTSDMGTPSASVVVMSLVDDRPVDSVGGAVDDMSLPAFLASQQASIRALLKRHGIRTGHPTLSAFPLHHSAKLFHVELEDVGDPSDHPHHRFRVQMTQPGGQASRAGWGGSRGPSRQPSWRFVGSCRPWSVPEAGPC